MESERNRLLGCVASKAKGTLRCIDVTHIKAHQDASNPEGGQQKQFIGHTKGGLNTKLSAIVHLNGNAIALALKSGPQADVRAATKELLGVLRVGDCLIGGKGCDSDALRAELLKMGVRDCLANRSNRTEDRRFNKDCYRKRHRVEDFFGRIKKARRIATRYEKLDAHFLGFVQLAAILGWLK